MKIPFDLAKLSPVITWLLRLWAWTIRFEVVGDVQQLVEFHRQGKPMVFAMWHNDLFSFAGFGQLVRLPLVGVVSQSKDGEIIARVLERLGHSTVRGSSSRGGVKALLQAKRIMEKEKRMAVFTIDGPRGPRHKAKDGVIFLAQRAGAGIIPVRAYPERKKVFEKSWDRFVLPFPFTRCKVYIGEPMAVTSEKLDKDVLKRERARLEERMHFNGPE